jgi:hypothetical protein
MSQAYGPKSLTQGPTPPTRVCTYCVRRRPIFLLEFIIYYYSFIVTSL